MYFLIKRCINLKILTSQQFLQKKTTPLVGQDLDADENQVQTFYAEIGIGLDKTTNTYQIFKVLFDTGSCVLWIPDYRCKSNFCNKHKQYKKSDTYTDLKKPMSAFYRDGQVLATLGSEQVFLSDDMVIENQVVGFGYDIDLPFMDGVNYDGIIGLAYYDYPDQIKKQQDAIPLFNNMIDQNILKNKGLKNIFAIYLGDNDGAITFGQWEDKYKLNADSCWVWVVLMIKNYWTFEMVDVHKIFVEKDSLKQKYVYNDKLCGQFGCQAVIDTGTYFIYGPKSLVDKILADVKDIDPCSESDLPDIVFSVVASKDSSGQKRIVELRMSPIDYIVKTNGQCIIGIKADEMDHTWTFGQLFLKTYYTVFDFENQQMGKQFIKIWINRFCEGQKGINTKIQLYKMKDL